MTYEIRTADMWPDVDYELRAAAGGFTFEGYAAVFDKPSQVLAFQQVNNGKPFREVIRQGAFTKTLAELPDITLRYQHNMTALPLARTKSGTLDLAADSTGLRVRADLPDNEWGRPVRDAIARGDIAGMSFHFRSVQDAWSPGAGFRQRELVEVRLGREVSITDIPAYPDTTASVRSLDEAFEALRAGNLTDEQRRTLAQILEARAAGDMPCCEACGTTDQCCRDMTCPPDCEACDLCDTTGAAAEQEPTPIVEIEVKVNQPAQRSSADRAKAAEMLERLSRI